MATATTTRANARKTMNGFWWANLASTDDAAAAEFYGKLFGWQWQEFPIGEGMVHRNATLGGHQIAGVDPVMPSSGMPTAWTNFVYVTDINQTVSNAKSLGATVVMEPMDVMGEGHMAIIVDPTGAALGIWQPGRHTGADAVNQPGTYTWVELATTDVEAAKRFYGELFGWGFERQPGEFEYWVASNEGQPMGGIMDKPEEMADWPSNWVTYFGVADAEQAAADVKAAGGKVVFGPMKMGPGAGVGVVDPQGGYFVAFQLDEWPAD